MNGNLPSIIGRVHDAVGEADVLDLVPRLMLVYLLLKPAFPWYANVPILVLAVCGLLIPELARRPAVWLVLALATSAKLVANWAFVDNHFFIVTYWCIALACCLSTREPGRALARSGRAMVGLIFFFALAWKIVLTRDWLDGSLFRDLLLTDPRFIALAQTIGGVDPATLQHNSSVMATLLQTGAPAASGVLREPAALVRLAQAATVWTTLIEVAVAALFLWPGRGRPASWRHAALLLFCWTTYAFGTVTGFGWMLVIMALAQCEPERKKTRLLYLGTFFLILAYARIPWGDQLVRLFGG